ncbi:MAG: DUF1624 domain-containing protein [Oscillospiraceae bacterium]|nr:DUF1624 domain-containing protein [Oscillospiraceae bacterium]
MKYENRIPELDLLRGLCILGMIAVHFIYDLTEIYPVFGGYSPLFLLVKNWGGTVFFLISGICVTLGHRHLRRGITVFSCGMVVSAVTVLAGFVPIRFGVLHALGVCMLCWECFKRASARVLAGCGIAFAVLGWAFEQITVSNAFLYPLGLTAASFESADFFPLFPNLGYFLLGACLGRRYYAGRKSLFPQYAFLSPVSRFLRLCGRRSLLLYLIHQPVLIIGIEAAMFIGGIFHENSP